MRLAALFCFTAASFGFLYFWLKYPRGSDVQTWGIRICYAIGFLGVAMHWLWLGRISQVSILIILSLSASLAGFELARRFLK